jgi:hypothetical protein
MYYIIRKNNNVTTINNFKYNPKNLLSTLWDEIKKEDSDCINYKIQCEG